MKVLHHLLDINKLISKYLYFFITFFYAFYCFKLNNYEIIFMDERLLIDDIYNIWLLDDSFGRFSNINNKFLESFLIVVTEASYGGDLRYGRLWSNLFTLLIGPFSLISDIVVITGSRLLNLFILNLAFCLLSKTFIQKKYFWLSMLALLSVPGVEFLIRIPKPDVLALLFISLGMLEYKKNKTLKSLFYLLIASFLKINFIFILFIFFFKIFKNSSEKLTFFIKSLGLSLISLVIVNPILIVPPITFFGIKLPNFYLKYYDWIFSQSTYGQDQIFSLLHFQQWIETMITFYLIPESIKSISLFLFFVLLILFLIGTYRSKDSYSKLFLIVFFIYMIFYMFFIERQFIWYINTPFIFLILSVLMNYGYESNFSKQSLIFVILFIVVGNISNMNTHYENKKFSANYKLGYEQIEDEQQAILLTDKVLLNVKKVYTENKYLDKKKVYWNPNLFIPRNNVTYIDNFFVREYWGPDDLDIILFEADIFVTNEEINLYEYKQIKVENYYIFYR